MGRHRFWLEPLAWSLGLLSLAAGFVLPPWLWEGSGLRFESPWFLLGLIGVPLVIVVGIFERRLSGKLRFPLQTRG